jgi:hypothetical protein
MDEQLRQLKKREYDLHNTARLKSKAEEVCRRLQEDILRIKEQKVGAAGWEQQLRMHLPCAEMQQHRACGCIRSYWHELTSAVVEVSKPAALYLGVAIAVSAMARCSASKQADGSNLTAPSCSAPPPCR